MSPEARGELVAVGKDMLAHYAAGTLRTAPGVMRIDAHLYTDVGRFEREKRAIFRSLPVLLTPSCALREPGSYQTMEIAGAPILLVRGKDGVARVFLNSCTHRGAILADGCGRAARFTCPYHGWTFDQRGALAGVASSEDFGAIDRADFALKQFPLLETAGLIWAVLDPASTLDIGAFLSGYDDMLEGFGFASWHLVDRRVLKGANWKLAFDAHLEFYHLPVLHRNTFGADISNRALYYAWGPHQRLARPSQSRPAPDDVDLFQIKDRPDGEWPIESLMFGEWILFPNVSINTFYDGGRGVILSQIFPGETVEESFTVQLYLMADEPEGERRTQALERAAFLARVVGEEDLPTSIGQQKALASGALDHVYFGRNEGGLQHFHRWIDRILDADPPDLADLFARDNALGAERRSAVPA